MKSTLFGLVVGLGLLGIVGTVATQLYGHTLGCSGLYENGPRCLGPHQGIYHARVFTRGGAPAGRTSYTIPAASLGLPGGWSYDDKKTYATDDGGRVCLTTPSNYLSPMLQLGHVNPSGPIDRRFTDRKTLDSLLQQDDQYRYLSRDAPFIINDPSRHAYVRLDQGLLVPSEWWEPEDQTSRCVAVPIHAAWYGYTNSWSNWRTWLPLVGVGLATILLVFRKKPATFVAGLLGLTCFVTSILVYALA